MSFLPCSWCCLGIYGCFEGEAVLRESSLGASRYPLTKLILTEETTDAKYKTIVVVIWFCNTPLQLANAHHRVLTTDGIHDDRMWQDFSLLAWNKSLETD
jgi:hypothetical protein